jgi:hypothetical protein
MPFEGYLEALALSEELGPGATQIAKVAKQTSPEAARWAFLQKELRGRAATKFEGAARMFFTREALEQATNEHVAAYHASHFPVGSVVVDMTCGIGADLMALARRGPAVGIELDGERAWCAAANLAANRLSGLVARGDSLGCLRYEIDYVMVDPARRVNGRRSLDLNEFSPNPFVVRDLIAGCRRAVMKLSPMVSDTDLALLGAQVEFVSSGGECREALVVIGSESVPGREAVHLESGERLGGRPIFATTESPKVFLYDLDPAAVRVGASGTLEEKFGLTGISGASGYMTSDQWVESPWLRGYEVRAAGSFDLKRIRGLLRSLDARIFEVKSRAGGLDTSILMNKLRCEGSQALSLILWHHANSVKFALGKGRGRVARSG